MRTSIEIIKRDGRKKLAMSTFGLMPVNSISNCLRKKLLWKLKEADSLILDLRDGWGGASQIILTFYRKVPIMTQVRRDGTRTTDYQWRNQSMLVNNGTRSGKFYGLKQYKIGTVIGTKTAGAVVGGRPFLLKDGNLLYLAVVVFCQWRTARRQRSDTRHQFPSS